MPRVRPFRALAYAQQRYGTSRIPERVRLPAEPAEHRGRIVDLTDLACPPYDVIDPEQREQLLARDPRNAVRLELSAEPDPHQAAAAELDRWIRDGTLERPPAPALFTYGHARGDAPDQPSVRGVLARVLLEPYGDEVRAHEHTMPGPRRDRLGLLRSTRTQLSPILALYFDGDDRYQRLMAPSWTDEWRARDSDGLLHQLAAIQPDDGLTGYLSKQRLFIADGHHRYETALAYQAEVRADPRSANRPAGALAADWIMAVLVNAEREAVEIRATHRLLRDVDPDRLRALPRSPSPGFEALPSREDELPQRLAGLSTADGAVFGLVTRNGDDRLESWLLVGDADAVAARMRREPTGSAVQRLDLAVLQAVILGDGLGLDPDREAGERILYTKDPADAVARVRSGDAQAALLVRPTRLDQLAAVASAGDVMPQKSTYFYPKLLTGMAFYPVEDG